jgi:predicted nucleic acid-binding protein
MDTSVLVKWFHSEGESELVAARALRSAHISGDLEVSILDLALYEIGNVLVRALKWNGTDLADQLDDLQEILGPPLVMAPEWLRRAAHLAHAHTLSYYDASWAATALELEIPLVTADRRLLAAGLAVTATEIGARYGFGGEKA